MAANDPRPVRLADVAARAGVSLATASRVLGGSSRVVDPELGARVRAAAGELGYVPNAHARAVARGSSEVLGLVVQNIADPYFSTIAAGVSAVAEQRGMLVLLGTTDRDPGRELELVSSFRSQLARAIVIVGSRWDDRDQITRMRDELVAYRSGGGRVACISEHRLGIHTIRPRNRTGAAALGRYLAGLGHRRFVVLGGPRSLLVARERVTGFRHAVTAAGAEVHVVHGAFTRDGGYDATDALLAEGEPLPTCVFAVNDVMAIGAMAALRDHRVAVPDEVSVAGFDDIETLRDVAPSLTTVQLPLHAMGGLVTELALDVAADDPARVRHIRGTVEIRDSTGPPRPDDT